MAHSRFTVAGEMSRTAPVSSTDNPPKVAQLHYPGLARVQRGQAVERAMQRHHVQVGDGPDVGHTAQRDSLGAAAALGRQVAARVIDQHSPHGLGRNGEEMPAARPLDVTLIDQPQIGLVHEGCRLQGVPLAFAAHVRPGQTVKFVLDRGQQGIEGGGVTVAPPPQEHSDIRPGTTFGEVADVCHGYRLRRDPTYRRGGPAVSRGELFRTPIARDQTREEPMSRIQVALTAILVAALGHAMHGRAFAP